MSHEIQAGDQLLLHKEPAWHDLGIVDDESYTPTEAQKKVLNWTCEQSPAEYVVSSGMRVVDPKKIVNYRSDNLEQLGWVTKNWKVFQPEEVAQFCERILDQGSGLKCETAGSIFGGKKIWFLLKGESWEAVKGDELTSYLLVSTGFDGQTAIRTDPTSTRVVCSNTLHAVIPDGFGSGYRSCAWSCSHDGDLLEKVADCRDSISRYFTGIDTLKDATRMMAVKAIKPDALFKYFLGSYEAAFEVKNVNDPSTEKEEKHAEHFKTMIPMLNERFAGEFKTANDSYWSAYNAFSGVLQHDMLANTKNETLRNERHRHNHWLGKGSIQTSRAFSLAFALAK